MLRFKKVILCMVLLMTLTGCQSNEHKTNSKDGSKPQEVQTTEVTSAAASKNHSFDPLKTKIGDRVAGLEVKTITYTEDYPSKDYPAEVEFTGQLQLTGNVRYHDEKDEFFPDCLTFEVSEESKKSIPRLAYDERIYWFAFSDQDKAAKLLGKRDIMDLTIVVKDYKVWYDHTEVCDLADIVEVMHKE